MRIRAVAVLLVVTACDFARLREDGLFRCELDRSCSQRTPAGDAYVCGADDVCRPPLGTDAGGADGGPVDGGDAPDGCTPTVTTCPSGACGLVPAGCGSFLSCAGCGAGTFCGSGNSCQPCSTAADLPDDSFSDSDCDGIDGQLDGGIFLAANGNDSAAGTRGAPVATLGAAFTLARASGHKAIYVASGTYFVGGTQPFSWDAPVSIYGGYSSDFAARSELNGAAVLRVPSGGVRITVTDGGVTIDHLAIEAANGPNNSSPSIAMTVHNARDVRLHHVTLKAGNGADGLSGIPAGVAGQAGQDGLSGVNAPSNSSPGGMGGQQTASSCGATGGKGGSGGSAGYTYGAEQGVGEAGGAGAANGAAVGSGGLRFTSCDLMGTCGCQTTGAAHDGGFGANGVSGANGQRGDGGTGVGAVINGVWSPASGLVGQSGQSGAGGNGGGGGGAHLVKMTATTFCSFSLPGGGGGAGGAGGCGGPGGGGGVGGGASIALLLVDGTVSARQLRLVTGAGGRGGAGGLGGPGGRGGAPGAGGLGFNSSPDFGGNGGMGGRGGDGGFGGPGGGGGGGPSVGVYCSGAALIIRDGGITFDGGAPGSATDNGLPGLGAAGFQCTGFP